MTFFDRENWRKWSPGCACSEEPSGVLLVAYTITGGLKRYGIRCATCGRINGGKPISPLSLTSPERLEAESRLVDLAQAKVVAEDSYKLATIKRLAELEDEREKWWNDYDTYLFTREWRERRAAVLERDDYTCRACLLAKATEVHHLTYRHVFNEPLFDLVAVCRECHESITVMDRQGIPKEYRERTA